MMCARGDRGCFITFVQRVHMHRIHMRNTLYEVVQDMLLPPTKNSKIVWRPTPWRTGRGGKSRSRKSCRTDGPCTRWQKGSSRSRRLSKRSTNCLPHGWKHNVEKMHMVDNENHLDNHQKKMFCTRAVDASEQWTPQRNVYQKETQLAQERLHSNVQSSIDR